MTKLKIKMLMDIAFTSSDSLLVREVASTCYKDGGRAVYMARNISNSYLKEYYTDEGCEYVGIEERELTQSQNFANIFPNPADEQLNIQLTENWESGSFVEIHVMNAAGQTLYNKTIQLDKTRNIVLPSSNFPAGLYYAIISNSKQSVNHKFVIVR